MFAGAIFLLAFGSTTSPSEVIGSAQAFNDQIPSNHQLASLFTPEVLYWEQPILIWSQEWGLDPNLVATVMQIESCGDPNAHSSAGAMGLFQVMPFHFEEYENPFAPSINAHRGLAYLSLSLNSHNGNTRLALSGYNGGITNSFRAESAWPSETVRYIYWGENIYQDAKAGRNVSATLEEWLSNGGSSLCNQASQRLGLNP
jgi:soluble lytic murein transglycosylase-like protein